MTFKHRIALVVTASALTFGVAAVPAAQAADSMSKDSMHMHKKKHKGMMKGDAMKGDAMKPAAPAQ